MHTIKNLLLATMIGTLVCVSFNSCTNDFVEINSDVRTIYEVEPERFLYRVQYQTSGHEYFYDVFAKTMPWLQYGIPTAGNDDTKFANDANVFTRRYSSFINTGSYMKHLEYLVNSSSASDADKARYQPVVEVARINLIYRALYASDVYGSLAYTEGWSMRSGGEITEPKFDTQEELFAIWDTELKNAISIIKSTSNPVAITNYDMAYSGDYNKWLKAANALRLRIALRYMKRDMAKAKSIAAEVLGSSDIPSSTDDSFIVWLGGNETNHEDYSAIQDRVRPTSTFMDYLNNYNDPRRRFFFRINNLTEANVAEWNAANPDDKLDEYGRWVGGSSSYDDNALPESVKLYKSRTLGAINMTPLNIPQTRIFRGAYDEGSGGSWLPRVTYADFCFMAAEFVLEGVSSSKSAENWYTEGVRSSLELWSKVGKHCDIVDYVEITETEIAEFLAQDNIKWNPAIGKEQIYTQAYVEHFKNTNESYAQYRRVGFPNPDCKIITPVVPLVDGKEQQIPRRIAFNLPQEGTINYENEMKRLQDMLADPDFGVRNDVYGRIWWDKK